MSKDEKQEDWMQKKWRPMMAIMYMTVCVFDFIIFPIMFTVVQFWEVESVNDAFRQWQPLTLIGAGLFHMAMGAVLGITAWSRGQEKIAGAAQNSQMQTPAVEEKPAMTTTQNTPSYKRVEPTLYTVAVEAEQQSKVASGYKGKPSPDNGPDPLI
jgi:hypothetical protein